MSTQDDLFCRNCGCQMKLRRGKYGEFYGCTGYPTCRNTMSKRDGEEEISGEHPELDGYDLAIQDYMEWGYDD